ncbi:MAG: sigma-70 family RNA polymerase sigma factor [Cyclobacteriaceae bacterium]|nr:sigma-70 family RNA polymerase sigma factor [Cyclobacteriaceae bacterium]
MENYKLSDSKLLSLYKNGNEGAFEQLLTKHKSRVYTTIYLIVKDECIAEDLLQETFIKAINTIKSGRYNEEGKFLPWILRIAHNMAIDHFRKQKRYPTIVLEDGSPVLNTLEFSENSFETAQIEKETHDALKDCINQLPETQKDVLLKRHYMGLSFQEIAEESGVSINTALGRMRYALINLRKMMKQYNIAYDKNFYPR